MIYRTLGSTGERVSAVGVGGWHLSIPQVDEKLSLRIVRTAIDRGINFMDNCWDYNDGESERRMGKALGEGYQLEFIPNRFFIHNENLDFFIAAKNYRSEAEIRRCASD
jgi:predicted aldo/keto reductase-like oxidoreductase